MIIDRYICYLIERPLYISEGDVAFNVNYGNLQRIRFVPQPIDSNWVEKWVADVLDRGFIPRIECRFSGSPLYAISLAIARRRKREWKDIEIGALNYHNSRLWDALNFPDEEFLGSWLSWIEQANEIADAIEREHFEYSFLSSRDNQDYWRTYAAKFNAWAKSIVEDAEDEEERAALKVSLCLRNEKKEIALNNSHLYPVSLDKDHGFLALRTAPLGVIETIRDRQSGTDRIKLNPSGGFNWVPQLGKLKLQREKSGTYVDRMELLRWMNYPESLTAPLYDLASSIAEGLRLGFDWIFGSGNVALASTSGKPKSVVLQDSPIGEISIIFSEKRQFLLVAEDEKARGCSAALLLDYGSNGSEEIEGQFRLDNRLKAHVAAIDLEAIYARRSKRAPLKAALLISDSMNIPLASYSLNL